MDLYEFIKPGLSISPTKAEEPIAKNPIIAEITETTLPSEIQPPIKAEDLSFLQQKIEQLESLLAVISTEKEDLTSKLYDIQGQKHQLEKLAEELKSKYDELNKQYDEQEQIYKTELEKMQDKIEGILKQNADLLKNNYQLTANIEGLNKEKDHIKSTFKQLQQNYDSLRQKADSDLDRKDKQIEDLKSTLTKLKHTLDEKQDMMQELKNENYEYKQKLSKTEFEFDMFKKNVTFISYMILIILAFFTLIFVLNKYKKAKQAQTQSPQPTAILKQIDNSTAVDNASVNKQHSMSAITPSVDVSDSKESPKTKKAQYDNWREFSVTTYAMDITGSYHSDLKHYVMSFITRRNLVSTNFKRNPSITLIYADHSHQKANVLKSNVTNLPKNLIKFDITIQPDRRQSPVAVVIGPVNNYGLKVTVISP